MNADLPAPLRLLLTGANGMLGTAMQRVAAELGVGMEAVSHEQLDITDRGRVEETLTGFAQRTADCRGCGVLVNAAAYTDVERAEDEPDKAFAVNAHGPGLLAAAAGSLGLSLVHVSTDYVFDGRKGLPYVEEDEPWPVNVYGASKLEGERRVQALLPDALLVRTSWVFGQGGPNFVYKLVERARARGRLRVVDDERGCPTYARDLAQGIVGLLSAGASGTFHLAGGGSCSRYEMALEVVRVARLGVDVEAATSDAFPTKARRPADSTLDCGKASLLGVSLPHWSDALSRFLSEAGVRA